MSKLLPDKIKCLILGCERLLLTDSHLHPFRQTLHYMFHSATIANMPFLAFWYCLRPV